MTDVSRLDDLAAAIDKKSSPRIRAYAVAQAAATQAQELELRKLRQEVEVLKRSVSPPPAGGPPPAPPATPSWSPLGWLNHAAYFPPSNIDKYGVAVVLGPPPAAFTGVSLRYMDAITCQDGTHAPSGATALANGWVMTDSDGNNLVHPQYGGYLADPGLPDYQAAWCNLALPRAQSVGAHGIWLDSMGSKVTGSTGGPRPAKYPSDASYEAALLSFAAYVKAFFDANNLKCAYNAFSLADNDGSATAAWWVRLGPSSHYLTCEFWLTPGAPAPPTSVRLSGGAQWYHNWEGFRALHTTCHNAGTEFLPLSDLRGQVYSLATFLLDWNGTGANMWVPNDSYVTTTDPWIAQYGVARNLGAPSGVATKTGSVWTRLFAGGRVTVDPVAGTATITTS